MSRNLVPVAAGRHRTPPPAAVARTIDEPEHAILNCAPDADPLAELVADERSRNLWRSVAALPSGQRPAVYLYYRQDMKVRDIAGVLGVHEGTVKTLLFRARQRLRGTMTRPEADPTWEESP